MIQVGIIEDEPQIRQSLQVLVNGSEGFDCRYVFSTAEDALRDIPNLGLHVVLTDIHLPGMSGIECIEKLKPKCAGTNFLICTSFEDAENVFKALKAGATGYLTKTTAPARLLEAILDVHNGGSPMSSHIARQVVTSFRAEDEHPDMKLLSTREREILEYISKGMRYREIADKIFISPETVRTHIRNIYEKLQVNSKTSALNKLYRR